MNIYFGLLINKHVYRVEFNIILVKLNIIIIVIVVALNIRVN